MTVTCNVQNCLTKTFYAKVELYLPLLKNEWLLENIPEEEDSSSKPINFRRMVKVALNNNFLVIFDSTKNFAQPLATVVIKKYFIKYSDTYVTLMPINNYHDSTIKFEIKCKDKMQQWKKTLQSSNFKAPALCKTFYSRKFATNLTNIKENRVDIHNKNIYSHHSVLVISRQRWS